MKLDELTAFIQGLERDITQKQHDLEIAKKFREVLSRDTNGHGVLNGAFSQVQMPLLEGTKAYGEVTEAIREAIRNAPMQYSINDIHVRLGAMDKSMSRDSLSQALHRLKQKGEITVFQPGKGRRPTVFTKGTIEP